MVDLEWSVLLPVKRYAVAKSRLRTGRPAGDPADPAHHRLVAAIVLDTLQAVLACPAVAEVVVVTDEASLHRAAIELGAKVVSQGGLPGLNAAVRRGARVAGRRYARAAVAADLPAMRPQELSQALTAAGAATATGETGLAFLADTAGTGTTLLAGGRGVRLRPRFGPDSAARHAACGAVHLAGDWPSLRLDVDTLADLAAAGRLGLGPRTSAWLAAAGADPASPRLDGMQGTIASYDPHLRSGTVLLDDGVELAFPAAAFDSSGLRLLRAGQRVRIDRDGPAIIRIGLITMPAE